MRIAWTSSAICSLVIGNESIIDSTHVCTSDGIESGYSRNISQEEARDILLFRLGKYEEPKTFTEKAVDVLYKYSPKPMSPEMETVGLLFSCGLIVILIMIIQSKNIWEDTLKLKGI